MSALRYEELVRELFPRLTGGIRWGLERTRSLLAAVGDPHTAYTTIHVGGTNGKGSVAATIAGILQAAGHRTGLYSSPHLTTFRERIRIAGQPIDEDALLAAAERLWPHITREKPSFFEATTAIGFLALADAGVDVAVVEVGLGGRLDATNVITPALSVLTNVSLDHVQLLGDTVEQVAREKAGIIKAGVPAITAESEAAVLNVFNARAQEVGARLEVMRPDEPRDVSVSLVGTELSVTTSVFGTLPLRTPLIGAHQARNVALAVHAVELLTAPLRPERDAVVDGVGGVAWPGRLQVVRDAGRVWLYDVAHNEAGVHVLVDALQQLSLPRPLVLLVGVLGDKDWRAMLRPLQHAADAVVLTSPPTAPADRCWSPHEVLADVPSPNTRVVEDFTGALETAWGLAAGGTIVVTGSFHTVGDAMIALGHAAWGADASLPPPSFAV
ncbi:MAG: bifunctional folylpolyglutamate synthase/dihydrofolate synthase [Longimicrobiales bacterium]